MNLFSCAVGDSLCMAVFFKRNLNHLCSFARMALHPIFCNDFLKILRYKNGADIFFVCPFSVAVRVAGIQRALSFLPVTDPP